MDRSDQRVERGMTTRQRPAFEKMLIDAATRALGAAPLALALGGSARNGLRPDAEQDINLVAVASGPPPSRLQRTSFGRTIDIVLESPESLERELGDPRNPMLIRLLAGAHVLVDERDLLVRAVAQAGSLLAMPPPGLVYPNAVALVQEIRDGAARLPSEREPLRSLVRGALLERIINLAYVRTGCWPAALRHAVDAVAEKAPEIALQIHRALDDDTALRGLAESLVAMPAAARSARTQRPPAPTPHQEVWRLPPSALARLSADSAAAIRADDLQRMSKLQVLTVRRVHGSRIGDSERGVIDGILAS